jgi:hypothetical protein
MDFQGEMAETPIPPEFIAELTKAYEDNLENEETIPALGTALIQALYLSMNAFQNVQRSRKKLYEVQKKIAAAVGLDYRQIRDFDPDTHMIVHRKHKDN